MQTSVPDVSQQITVSWWQRLCNRLFRAMAYFNLVILATIIINISSSLLILATDTPFIKMYIINWILSYPLVVLGGIIGDVVLTVVFWIFGRIPAHSATVPVPKQNRIHMIRRLLDRYRSSLNEQTAWLPSDLENKPNVLPHPTNLLLRKEGQPEVVSTSIVEVYEQATQELLLLGKPGVGKSRLLYQLGIHLLEQAEQDEALPLPIVLPLSSWNAKCLNLQEWICEQLCSPYYNVPHQISQQWVQNGQIIPLLDGLDEMEEAARPICIAAINRYSHEHLMPLVVSSRENDIAAVQQQLTLKNVVVVQPLTEPQINAYFGCIGKPLAALYSAVKKNDALKDLVINPLMLNILTLTYWGEKNYRLSSKIPLLYQQVWDTYVDRMMSQKGMVNEKGNAKCYSLECTCPWLHWLALQMRVQKQSNFYLEQLQVDWLPTRQRYLYQWTIRVITGLLGLVCGTLLNLVIGGPLNGLMGGLVWVPSFIWIFGRNTEVKPIEVRVWSKNGARHGAILGFACGVILKLVLGIIFKALNPTAFFLMAPTFGLFGMLAWGISGEQLPAKDRLTLNQGIWRSAKIGLFKGLFIGSIIGLISGITIGIMNGLALGLFSAVFWGLQGGLIVVVKHFLLRIWIWRTQVFPWNVSRFLNDARVRGLLKRKGGGYEFTHRLLLDYFADMYPKTLMTQAPVQTKAKPVQTKY